MKSLELLCNTERARLLFDLFPHEIIPFVSFTKSVSETICNDPDYVKQQWEDQLLTLECWLRLAGHARTTIERYKTRFAGSSRLVSDQLFDGYDALFAVHCLHGYAASEECRSENFKAAVTMFFLFDASGHKSA
jgi:hypothetical protein